MYITDLVLTFIKIVSSLKGERVLGEELEHYHGKKHNHESYSASVNSVEKGGREKGRGGAGQGRGSAKLEESDSEAGINQSALASSHVNILHLLLRGGVLVYLIFVKSLSYIHSNLYV